MTLPLSADSLNNSYTPTRRDAREEKTVENTKNFTTLASITNGKVGVPHLPIVRQIDKSETNQVLKAEAKKSRGTFFFRDMLIILLTMCFPQ